MPPTYSHEEECDDEDSIPPNLSAARKSIHAKRKMEEAIALQTTGNGIGLASP